MRGRVAMPVWRILAGVGLVLLVLPLFFIILQLFMPTSENWLHVKAYMLNDIMKQTLLLTIGSAISAAILGTSLALIMAHYSFPGKKIFDVLLILPLALPSYIAAFTYSAMLGYTGAVQVFLRNTVGLNLPQQLFNIRTVGGAIFIFTITLYPYVYLVVRATLERLSASMIETATILAPRRGTVLRKIIFPLIVPAMIGSMILVALEVLNDFGVSSYFGIQTFSTAIFQAWHGMFDINLAFRLASFMLAFVLLFTVVLKFAEHNSRYQSVSSRERHVLPVPLKGFRSVIVIGYCLIIALVSFVLPLLQMIVWTTAVFTPTLLSQLATYTKNTVFVALTTTVLILIFNLILANVARLSSKKVGVLFKLANIGYMMPSAVLAISTVSLFLFIEHRFLAGTKILSSSLMMLVYAYFVKYFVIGFQSVDEGFNKVGMIYTDSSRLLGYSVTKTFFKVDLAMVRAFILSGGVLVFLDVVKELPLALTLRTFNFQTLSTRVYMFAINEQLAESAPYSLVIIIISSVFIWMSYRIKERMWRI